MKRFFCIDCNSVRRVRNLPSNITNGASDNPKIRVGQCDRHISSKSSPNRASIRRTPKFSQSAGYGESTKVYKTKK